MKYILGICLLLSLSLNVYLIVDDIRITQSQEFGQLVNKSMGIGISKTKWTQSLKIFQTKLTEEHKPMLGKKYYYINIWTSWCAPCIREMPWLDSLAGNLRKDVGYVFVTELSDVVANKVIHGKNYNLKNFIFLNEMNDFVSGICNEQGIKNKVYPMVLILSNKGKVLHYSVGAYSNKNEASGFADLINKTCK